MLSHNEYVIWTIANNALRIAVGICNNTEFPMVYLKDLTAEKNGCYDCYSYYSGAMSPEQAKEIIDAAKNKENRKVQITSRNTLIRTTRCNAMKTSDMYS